MSEEMSRLRDKIHKLDTEMRTGFAALKVMKDNDASRITSLEHTLEKLRMLSERVAVLEAAGKEITGSFRLEHETHREEKRLSTERWKANAGIIVSLITSIVAILSAILDRVYK